MTKKKVQHSHLLIPLCLILIALLFFLGFQIYFLDRIYPFVWVNNINVGGLTIEEAKQKVNASLSDRLIPLKFSLNAQDLEVTLKEQDLAAADETVVDAYNIGRRAFYPFSGYRFRRANLFSEFNLNPKVKSEIAKLTSLVNEPAIDAQIKVDGDIISVSPSSNGLVVNEDKLSDSIEQYLQTGERGITAVPTQVVTPNLSYEDGLEIKKTLDQIKLHPLVLKAPDQNFSLGFSELLTMIDNQPQSTLVAINEFKINEITVGEKTYRSTFLHLNRQKLENYLKELSNSINKEVKEPVFSFDQSANGGKGKVTEFEPPQEGVSLNIDESIKRIDQSLASYTNTPILLSVEITPTKNKLINELGIKELVGSGYSRYLGSIPNRIYNVWLTAQKLNGTIVAPGETFSFVHTIGDITAATGFKQAYVIKSGRTVLDDGGGVCQVSTTLYRAILNSGLPVVERTAHAYRVSYYEQGSPPGIDATVFYPSVDLKFKNDTQKSILIQAYTTDNLELFVNLYGTSDGRVSEITTPIIHSQSPALPDLRQDDPTLPKGQVKQVDWSAAGANISFKRTVTRDGQTLITETWRSNYRPWQAVYLVGTKE